MKKILLSASLVVSMHVVNAQAVPNGTFENWNSVSFQDPRYYPLTSNYTNSLMGLPDNVLRVADPQAGTYAIQCNTVTNGIDTSFGYFINGDPNTWAGGIAYNQHPITVSGYYKSNIPANDSALMLVLFKEAGVPVSIDVMFFHGVHSTYTPFTITLTIPPLANPDSLIIGGVSSDAFNFSGIPGSMIQFDNLQFNGVLSQPANLNGSFELWDQRTSYTPMGWSVGGDTVYRSTTAHGGNYSLRLGVNYQGGPYVNPAVATTGQLPPQSQPIGGRPYVLMLDTLVGWYQFTTTGNDSATLWIQTSNNGTPVGGNYIGLPPAATWTAFSAPFSSFSTPDTLMVTFAGIYSTSDSTSYGNILLVDDISLKSSPLSSGLIWNQFGLVKVYPNPASDATWIEFNNVNGDPMVLSILDEAGRKISEEQINDSGMQRHKLDLSGLASGSYMIVLEQNGQKTLRKLIVQ